MLSLLHLSDLHRTSAPHVYNDELLAAIISDSTRWAEEGIPRPQLIVVSGDVVQGAAPDDPAPDRTIEDQYAEATEFLKCLCHEFVGDERQRVIVVPGNHDVHWQRSRASMAPLPDCPPEIARLALDADSKIRWDWNSQQAFEISDSALYESRLDHFRHFREEFYSDIDPSPLDAGSDLLVCEHADLSVVIVGFASWYGNDCYCDVGEISRDQLALAQEALRTSQAPMAVAVWHHSVRGGPTTHDYMDERVLHRLIDFGFCVGLHGHQHFPRAAPHELRLPNETSMAVIGAGSLAVGDAELPMGERRQFNIVLIEPEAEKVTAHVREMSKQGVFSGSYRTDFGGKTYLEVPYSPSRARPAVPSVTERLDDAMTALREGQFHAALSLADGVDDLSKALQRRQITVEALVELGRVDELVALLNPPQTVDEVVRGVSVLINAERFDEAERLIELGSDLTDSGLADDLRAQVKARRLFP